MGFDAKTADENSEVSLLIPTVTAIVPNKIPKDSFHLAYIIYFTLSLGYLIPWNAFITVVDYFTYLYPDASVDRIFSIAYKVVGLFSLLLIIFYSHKSEAHVRINVGIGLFVVSLLVVPLMDVFYIKGRVGSILHRFAATIASNEHSSLVALLKNMARSVFQVMGTNINSHTFDENRDGCPEEMSRGRRISITQFKSGTEEEQSSVSISAGSPSPSTASRPPTVPAAKTLSCLLKFLSL
ncbi:hypothetical protein ACFX12_035592 [Malus domestica]